MRKLYHSDLLPVNHTPRQSSSNHSSVTIMPGTISSHRVTSATYPYGSNSSNTPSKCFVYDAAIDNQTCNANPERRLAEAYTTTSACSSTNLPATITDEAFSYTARGEITTAYESTPHSSGYLWVTQSIGPTELQIRKITTSPVYQLSPTERMAKGVSVQFRLVRGRTR